MGERRFGFKLRDLLIILLSIPLVGVGLYALGNREWEAANRTKCAKTLRSFGQAILLYANDNRGAYPGTRYEPTDDTVPTWGTGAWSPEPFAADGPGPNDVSAALFLLARTQDITMELFVCPSTNATAWDMGGKDGLQVSNWPRDAVGKHLDYSYMNEYHSRRVEELRNAPGFKRATRIAEEFPLMADLNPGATTGETNVTTITTPASTKELKSVNSRNHRGNGQNVLYEDGHVDWQINPFVGIQRDNIYARRAASTGFASAPPPIARAPYDLSDSVLLPCEE